jgi:chorismate synthase
MNTLGRSYRTSILGESHGEAVGVLIDGTPAGLPLAGEDFRHDLSRRQGGTRGTTTRKEADPPLLKSGVFKGKTTGTPILILFENKDVDSKPYEKLLDTPRPGHADLVARQKFAGFNDFRGGGHFSGRLTAGLVAAGVIAKKLLKGVDIQARLTEAGGCKDIEKAIVSALERGDSVGGIVECRVKGLPSGLGEPFFNSAESLLSHAAFAIPAVKGVEFGDGFALSRMRGSESNDEILTPEGRTKTNHAGGIHGGITNGNELIFRVAVKPTSSIRRTQRTVSLKTGKAVKVTVEGRHDACIALRVPVVLEAITAMVLADLMLQEQRIPRVWRE